jgi:hypothetical protein
MFLIKTNLVKNRWLYVAIWNIGKCIILSMKYDMTGSKLSIKYDMT